MDTYLTMLERELRLASAHLSELDGYLARVSERRVREALANVETMRRLEDRAHALGNREAA